MGYVFKIILIIYFVCVSNIAFADKISPPASTVISSDDGQVVYVNRLNRDQHETIYSFIRMEKKYDGEFSIKDYPENGLYVKSSHKFLWQLENNDKLSVGGLGFRAVPLNDRHNMVISHPMVSSISDSVIEIYRDGKLFKSFQVRDFCENQSTFMRTESMFVWMHHYYVESLKNVITFVACKKNFKIDIITGKFSFTDS